jgi:hypothetical protein
MVVALCTVSGSVLGLTSSQSFGGASSGESSAVVAGMRPDLSSPSPCFTVFLELSLPKAPKSQSTSNRSKEESSVISASESATAASKAAEATVAGVAAPVEAATATSSPTSASFVSGSLETFSTIVTKLSRRDLRIVVLRPRPEINDRSTILAAAAEQY